ncbi:MAG: GNAT family N-acetyltransferase [Ferruginibacter sp.]
MPHLLNNPVYNALISGDANFNIGTSDVKFFNEQVSPFGGFNDEYENGFEDLHELLPQGRRILYADPKQVEIPKNWKLKAGIGGVQFVLEQYVPQEKYTAEPVALGKENIEAMMQLTTLTRPGPFDNRTIEFGSYFGIFQNGKLVAMTGQRLHIFDFTEISAVCTNPDYLGKGFAGTLLHHQVELILKKGQTPFLHVRADNKRAIELYERIGFKVSRPMNFYFLENL